MHVAPLRPLDLNTDDRPASAANCYLSHVRLFKFIEKTERRGIARHPAACAFASLCVPPRARPLSLHRAALLRVIPFAQACPRQSRLPHRQEPSHVRIRIAVHAPARASHPAAACGPAEGYFTCANPSTAVPVTHPPQAVRPGSHFCVFPPHHPGARLRPFPLPVLCSDRRGHPPRYMLVEITHGNALTRARLSLGLPHST